MEEVSQPKQNNAHPRLLRLVCGGVGVRQMMGGVDRLSFIVVVQRWQLLSAAGPAET